MIIKGRKGCVRQRGEPVTGKHCYLCMLGSGEAGRWCACDDLRVTGDGCSLKRGIRRCLLVVKLLPMDVQSYTRGIQVEISGEKKATAVPADAYLEKSQCIIVRCVRLIDNYAIVVMVFSTIEYQRPPHHFFQMMMKSHLYLISWRHLKISNEGELELSNAYGYSGTKAVEADTGSGVFLHSSATTDRKNTS